jgi:malonyl-CoA O-methyltransferase
MPGTNDRTHTPIDKELVRKHFNRHAHEYDQYAGVQPYMSEKLFERIKSSTEGMEGAEGTEDVKDSKVSNILEIGCGTGHLTAMLLAFFPSARYDAIDLSEAMVAAARNKLDEHKARLSFIAADAEALLAQPGGAESPLRQSYDLIVSSATFQWFSCPRETVVHCLNKLSPGGLFAFSTFGPRTFYELHESFYAAERLLDLPHKPHGQTFLGGSAWERFFSQAAGIRGTWQWSEELREFVYPSVRDFLNSVKRIGAGNAVAGGDRYGISGRRLLLAMQNHYAAHYATPYGIKATYDLGFALYKKQPQEAG